ncbi:hypothetical protein [Dyadobacter sp. Leaf189]|uniref:hypothetical protein n=1 Tax=Dyadobacter sp. Leaf189 TaxID=1736295 RepID=UPI0006FCBAB0|nr:hypothetical protein [Dyadobacter sp. Leaf189]KQS33976.1 hypothetical protein ASG33_08065 [Dyadobacter sp. Leaf189]
MKTSIKRIQEFYNASSQYLKEHKEDTKFKYALEKVLSRISPCFQEYQDLKEDIELEHANVDANGSVLFTHNSKGQREYQFKKEDIKKVRAELKALFTEERFEIKGHICNEVPSNVDESFLPIFQGFVITGKGEQITA